MIQVFHSKSFREGTIAEMDGLGAVYALIMKGGYERVASVDTYDLEEAYVMTNSMGYPWTQTEGVKVVGLDKKRSTSVGDILLKGERFYLVSPVGFTEITFRVPVGQIGDAA